MNWQTRQKAKKKFDYSEHILFHWEFFFQYMAILEWKDVSLVQEIIANWNCLFLSFWKFRGFCLLMPVANISLKQTGLDQMLDSLMKIAKWTSLKSHFLIKYKRETSRVADKWAIDIYIAVLSWKLPTTENKNIFILRIQKL